MFAVLVEGVVDVAFATSACLIFSALSYTKYPTALDTSRKPSVEKKNLLLLSFRWPDIFCQTLREGRMRNSSAFRLRSSSKSSSVKLRIMFSRLGFGSFARSCNHRLRFGFMYNFLTDQNFFQQSLCSCVLTPACAFFNVEHLSNFSMRKTFYCI